MFIFVRTICAYYDSGGDWRMLWALQPVILKNYKKLKANSLFMGCDAFILVEIVNLTQLH